MTDSPRPGHLGGVGEASLRAIYDRYHDAVWRTLACLGVPDHAIEDAVQEVFLVVHRRLEDPAQYGSLKSWIYAIARRVAWHVHRGAARAQRKLAAVEVAHTDDLTPEAHAQQMQARAILLRILDAMPHEQRVVFVLAEIEGLSAPEIAESAQVALNTVYSRLRLARARFERETAQLAERHDHGT